MNKIILAFDLGTNIGLAHNALPAGAVAASIVLTGDRCNRATEFMGYTQNLLKQFEEAKKPIDAVVYERPFARGFHATRSLWGLAGILEAVAHDAGAAVLDITPSEIKKFATGSGRASKEDMILFASTTGYAGDNEHEADAWCLLRMAETLKWKEP